MRNNTIYAVSKTHQIERAVVSTRRTNFGIIFLQTASAHFQQ